MRIRPVPPARLSAAVIAGAPLRARELLPDPPLDPEMPGEPALVSAPEPDVPNVPVNADDVTGVRLSVYALENPADDPEAVAVTAAYVPAVPGVVKCEP